MSELLRLLKTGKAIVVSRERIERIIHELDTH